MSLKDTCSLQYYYPTEELSEKYKIDCANKNFKDIDDINTFNNEQFLEFINEKYGDGVFGGDSPFTFKDDYMNLTNENICKTDEYSLKPQQKFVGQFINPATNFNNTLVFHGLGSGKTCTSLVIGEAFKNNTRDIKLLYVVPAPLIQQYTEEILGELKLYDEEQMRAGKKTEIWSCTSQCIINGKRDFYTNINERSLLNLLENDYAQKQTQLNNLLEEINKSTKTGADISLLKKEFFQLQNLVQGAKSKLQNYQNQLMSKVTKTFTIISHNIFINNLFKETKDGTWTKMSLLKDNSPLLSSNGLLIIDEIQRLVSESGILYNKLFSAIYQYINPKCRIVLLTATPVYDNPYELALTMNLLRPRMPFPLNKQKFYSFFLGKYDDSVNECVRVIKNNFITDDSCVINKDLLQILCSGYVSYFKGGNPIAYPYKRIITMEHRMPYTQKMQYINALQSDISKDKSLYSKILGEDEFIIKNNSDEYNNNKKEDSVSGIYTTSQQFCNIALPFNKSDLVDSLLTNKAQKNVKAGLDKFKGELKKLSPKTLDHVLNYIRGQGYSEKFVNIIKLSSDCNGPVFIFSNWLQFGVQALSIILDACGYKKFPEEGELRYFVWSSETSTDKELIRKARNTFNSFDNRNGSLLKIILGTRSIMEGVSFKNVKQVHITDPWWNEARIEQILARAVRFCSHSNLPLEEQYTDIFRHYSILPNIPDDDVESMLTNTFGKSFKNFKNFAKSTIEQRMAISSGKKYQINNEFEEILKEVAYDCNLNTKGNIIRLEEKIRPLSSGNYNIYFQNPNTLQIFIRQGIPYELTFEQMVMY